jgi:putative hemolysin
LRFKQLSYASESDSRLKRWLIGSIEGLSGRDRYVQIYDISRSDIVPTREGVFGKLLDLLDVRLDINGAWPPQPTGDRPLVIVANHPFGIGDGIAVLALAERLGRPFRVLIHNELLKVPEMAAYSLPYPSMR